MTKISTISKRYDPKSSELATTISSDGSNWRQLAFWRNIFLYYWGFAFVGHLIEVFWRWFTNNQGFDPNNIPTIAPLAAPYGLGAVAIILLVYPLCKRFKKINVLVVFVLSMLVTTAVEYLCAVVIVVFLGHNPFWDYSHEAFNLQGYVCLRNAVLFGIISTVFLRAIFPRIEKRAQKVSQKLLNDLFILLATTYAADLLLTFIVWLVNR
jgi:uncharacterized membrane protein